MCLHLRGTDLCIFLKSSHTTPEFAVRPYQDRSAVSDLTSSDMLQEARVTDQPCGQRTPECMLCRYLFFSIVLAVLLPLLSM